MKKPLSLLAFVALATATSHLAHAQPHTAPDGGARSAAWVVHRAPGRWPSTCVAVTGCARPAALPRCAPTVAPPSDFARVFERRASLAGQTVRVLGRFASSATTTSLECIPGTCCNQVALTHTLTGLTPTEHQFALGENGATFNCFGDNSGMCCATAEPRGNVVVSGVLRALPNSDLWRIEAPQVCDPG